MKSFAGKDLQQLLQQPIVTLDVYKSNVYVRSIGFYASLYLRNSYHMDGSWNHCNVCTYLVKQQFSELLLKLHIFGITLTNSLDGRSVIVVNQASRQKSNLIVSKILQLVL